MPFVPQTSSYTGSTVVTEVRRTLGDLPGVLFTDADALSWVNAGQREIASELDLFGEATVDLVAGQADYTIPVEISKRIRDLQVLLVDGKRLRPLSYQQAQERWMDPALEEARGALGTDDVPVGAVVVDPSGRVVGRGRNAREALQDPTAHAEVLALRAAASATGSWRLSGLTLVVTLEPCTMCAGAAVLARVDRIVYGAVDLKAGAAGSLSSMLFPVSPTMGTSFLGAVFVITVLGGMLAATLLGVFFVPGFFVLVRRDRRPPAATPEK